MDEARKLYEESIRLAPNVYQTLYGWSRMEETDRNFTRASELLDEVEKALPDRPNTRLARRIGLVWAGRPEHGNDRNRSLTLNDLAPLASLNA